MFGIKEADHCLGSPVDLILSSRMDDCFVANDLLDFEEKSFLHDSIDPGEVIEHRFDVMENVDVDIADLSKGAEMDKNEHASSEAKENEEKDSGYDDQENDLDRINVCLEMSEEGLWHNQEFSLAEEERRLKEKKEEREKLVAQLLEDRNGIFRDMIEEGVWRNYYEYEVEVLKRLQQKAKDRLKRKPAVKPFE